jgi:hypothetical protein
VLARVVQIAHAHNDPGAGVSVEEITGLEDQVGVPVLPMAVRIRDGECPRHSSPSRFAWRNGSGSAHGGREAIGSSTLSVAPPDFFDFPRYEWGPWFIPRSTRFRRMSHVFEAAVNDWESRGVLTAEDFEVIESD